MLSRNAPLLYVQQQGGWRSGGSLRRQRISSGKSPNYFSTQKPWASMPSATLNLLRKNRKVIASVCYPFKGCIPRRNAAPDATRTQPEPLSIARSLAFHWSEALASTRKTVTRRRRARGSRPRVSDRRSRTVLFNIRTWRATGTQPLSFPWYRASCTSAAIGEYSLRIPHR